MYQPDSETLITDKIRKIQLDRLRNTIRHIRDSNSDYHERVGGVDPEEIRDLDDLADLPFLTKEDLRNEYPYNLICVGMEDIVRMHMSSGTTGTPIINPFTRSDVDQWREIMARCLATAGVGKNDVIQITPSFGLFNGGFGFHYGADTLGAFIIPIGAGRTSLQLQFFRDLKTTALGAIASYPLRLMEVAREQGFDWNDTELKVGILGAEIWSDEMRSRIEAEMGIKTFDIIGMTESGGIGMGIDCEAQEGIHVWEDHYLIEIVDPDTGAVMPDGEMGEMTVTTLTREALPLIRLRTSDITAVVSRDPCSCGRTHLRVERITGRTDDMIKVKGVNFYPKQVEALLLGIEGVGMDYLIKIDRVAGRDSLKIAVEVDDPENDRLAEKLNRILLDYLSVGADIELLSIGEIERSPGKAVRVQDTR